MSSVVPRFIDVTYRDEVVFLAAHLSDAATIPWSETRWSQYGPPGGNLIPQVVVGCDPNTYVGYPGVPPNQWINRVEAERAIPTDILMDLDVIHVGGYEWRVSAQVCMEPTGSARTVRTYIGYTMDGWPSASGYTYRSTLRSVGAYEDLALNPGDCLDVDRDFTLSPIDVTNLSTVTAVAWAQTPNAGFGESYQAAKRRFVSLFDDGFESGDLAGWSVVQP
jgi:hypothetical protein